MEDWYGKARDIIATVHETLPADADLHTRHQACIRAKPFEFASTSWGQKTWARAQREYLMRYGYEPRTPALPESPMKRRSGAATTTWTVCGYLVSSNDA